MWGGTLQFKYRDSILYAANDNKEQPIVARFDFEEYRLATQTKPVPKAFQQLVQHAIGFYLHENKPKDNFKKKLNWSFIQVLFQKKLPVDICEHIAKFIDECYVANFALVLFPHQIEALRFIGSRPRSLLAADTGLGKTAVSIAHIVTSRMRDILLIVPPTLKLNWCSEIRRCLTNFKLFVIDKKIDAANILTRSNARQMNNHDPRFFIVSYNILETLKKPLVECKFTWDLFLFDEAHALKNPKSQRSKTAYDFVMQHKPKNVLFLSATPSCYAKDWWGLLRFMDPVMFGKYFHNRPADQGYTPSSDIFYFAERYVEPHPIFVSGGEKRWDFSRSVRMEELHALTRPFVLTQKKDILKLPPLLRDYIVVAEATQQQQKLYYEAMRGSLQDPDVDVRVSFNEQVKETSVNKLPAVQKYILSLLENPAMRFSLWAHHKFMIQGLCECLLKNNIEFICINGDTPKKDRDHLLHIMATNQKVRVAVLSINTCGTGLNMAFLDFAVYAELTTHQMELVQSEGRHQRIGQKSDCVIAQYLIYRHSTDEVIWNSILRKANVESVILTNKKANFDFDIRSALETEVTNYFAQHPQTKPNKRKAFNDKRFGITSKKTCMHK